MFANRYSYHETIRKAIVAFGTVFNDITIKRFDASGAVTQIVPVPISYAPKQKFVQRNEDAPTLDTGRAAFENIVPRLGYEITGIAYDPTRKLSVLEQHRQRNTDGSFATAYVSTPYNLAISLTSWTKTQADALQIVEQILPYFSPDFSVPVFELPELNIKRDLQIVLTGTDIDVDYTGSADQRTMVFWTFNFTMRINIYGYVATANVIKEAIARVYANTENPGAGIQIDTQLVPPDASPTSDYTVNVDVSELFGT